MRLLLRTAGPEDAEGITDVLAKYARHHGPVPDETVVGSNWSFRGRHAVTAVLAADDGRLFGAVRMIRASDVLDIAVRGRPGFGATAVRAALVDEADRLARRWGVAETRTAQPITDVPLRSALLDHGYAPTGELSVLRTRLAPSMSTTLSLPSGVTVGTVDRRRERVRVAAAFASAASAPRAPITAPLLIAARREGEVIGWIAGGRRLGEEGATGVIDGVEVRPDERGRGVGRGLLAAMLTRFATENLPEAVLVAGPNDPTGITAVARGHGMTGEVAAIAWRRRFT